MFTSRREFLRHTSLIALPVPVQVGRSAGSAPVVDTRDGKIRGESVDGIDVFRGIPYGGDTSGINRFMPPTRPKPWTGVRDATQWGHVAPQKAGSNSDYTKMVDWLNRPGGEGEDCLALNVWTPGLGDRVKRPVLFSIHGGGYTSGCSSNPVFNGLPLAKRHDVVVVTINHRLGALGYLNLAEFDPAFARSGVAGMLDCVAALEWVRDNISRFGGDPGNVMIFGQSGGGSKVCHLMVMPAAKGLFHKAAMQSGVALKSGSREATTRNAARLLDQLGIDKNQVRKLQEVPVAKLIEAQPAQLGPFVDGVAIPRDPFDPSAPDISAAVPILVGTCLDDNALNITNFSLDEAGLKAQLTNMLGDNAGHVLAAYRAADPKKAPCLLLARITTDRGLRRNAFTLADRKAEQHKASAYMYLLTWPSVAYNGKFGAVHGTDVPLSFDNVDAWPITGTGAEARLMARRMSAAWVAFAKTGNPANPELPAWPAWNPESHPTMILNNQCRVENDPGKDLRALL